ncbi:hypothetical protein F4804DRAFT_313486 [Jackrogersella minutella]|nr:hypothetical protein F4804DRAFT_313486 [Jackrogersella minutella]
MDYTEQLIWSCYGMMEIDSRERSRLTSPPQAEANFVIGISGCTSAGKTTLALLLDAVLQKAVRRAPDDDDDDRDDTPRTAVIHQDAYFHKQKEDVGPAVAVQPLWPEDRLVAAMAGPDDPPTLVEDRDRVGSCDVEMLAGHVDEPDPEVRATAVPNPRFLRNLARGQEEGSDVAAVALAPGTMEAAVAILRGALGEELCRDGAPLDQYAQVDDGVPAVARRFTVLEGFTLFARDADQDPVGWVAPGSEAHTLRVLRHVQERLDVALFLPVGRDDARRRRFGRERYTDVPEGTRKPGQYWKCGGYFDQVAWPHYERYHRHILPHLAAAYAQDDAQRQQEERQHHGRPWCAANVWERDPCVNGVHVRPPAANSVDDTLLWASSVVGAVLATRLLREYESDSQHGGE